MDSPPTHARTKPTWRSSLPWLLALLLLLAQASGAHAQTAGAGDEEAAGASEPTGTTTSAPAAVPTPAAVAEGESSGAQGSPVGWFVGAGAAGVTMIVGVAYWLNRDNALEDCRQAIADGLACSDEDSLRRQRNAGISLAAIGGAALPALIVMGALRARDREPDDADMVWLPAVDPTTRSASLGVSGRF
ncbi:MAG: hypothetical protein U0230_12010 [Polyangiales bacterium]